MRLILILFLSFIFQNIFYSQAKIVEIRTQNWNLEDTEWEEEQLETFKYNQNGEMIHKSKINTFHSESLYEYFDVTAYYFNNSNKIEHIVDSIYTLQDKEMVYLNISDQFFEYDAEENIVYDSSFSGSNNVILVTKNTFDEQNRIVTKINKELIPNMRLIRTTNSEYNSEDLLVLEKVNTNYLDLNLDLYHIVELSYYNDSQVESRISYPTTAEYEISGPSCYTEHYEYPNQYTIFKTIEKCRPDSIWNWNLALDYHEEIEYSSTGKIIKHEEIRYEGFQNYARELHELSYDQNDSLIQKTTFGQFNTTPFEDGLVLYETQNWSYEYDENDYLIEKEYKQKYAGGSTQVENHYYSNFCDGLVKVETIHNLNSLNLSNSKKSMKYDIASECIEDKQNQTLNIFPNPTTGLIKIESNLLSAQNNQINIYSTDGRFLRTAKVDFRTEEMTLDLSDLSNGIYFIEVKNEGGRLTKKVIIAK